MKDQLRGASSGSSSGQSSREVDIFFILESLIARKGVALSILIASLLLSFLASFFITKSYTVVAVLAPAESASSPNRLSELATQFGGLAQLAGINVGGLSGKDKTRLIEARLISSDFFRTYLFSSLWRDLYAVEGFDSSEMKTLYDDEIYDVQSDRWLKTPLTLDQRFRGYDPSLQPSASMAHERMLKRNVRFLRDQKTGVMELTCIHRSPTVAEALCRLIVQSIDSDFREKEIKSAEEAIIRLQKLLRETSQVELEKVFNQLIEDQMRSLSLAKVSQQFLVEYLDEPRVNLENYSPKLSFVVLAGSFIGAILSLFVVSAIEYARYS